MWAERRTDIVNEDAGNGAAPDVEAVSLWVHLDAERWRPSPVTQAEIDTYGGMPARRVSARLRHPAPETTDGGAGWAFRATECDIADHVNNAAYWQPLEEELLAGEDPAAAGRRDRVPRAGPAGRQARGQRRELPLDRG